MVFLQSENKCFRDLAITIFFYILLLYISDIYTSLLHFFPMVGSELPSNFLKDKLETMHVVINPMFIWNL